jgi:hypothetical protein
MGEDYALVRVAHRYLTQPMRNVGMGAYPPVMSTDLQQRYRVTVAHVLAEAAAAVVAAEDLMTAWTSARTLLSMVVKSACRADALSAGQAVARVMGCGQGATVEAEALGHYVPLR